MGIEGPTAREGKKRINKKHRDLRLSAPGKPCFHTEKDSTAWLAKTGLTQTLASLTPVPPPVAATAYDYCRRQHRTPDAMSNPRRRRPPRLVAEVLSTGRLPNTFAGVMLSRFGLTYHDGTPLSTDLRKGGGIHAFLGRLTYEVAPAPGISELTVLRFDRDRGAHILHSLFSVPVGAYNPNQRLFDCCGDSLRGELPATLKQSLVRVVGPNRDGEEQV